MRRPSSWQTMIIHGNNNLLNIFQYFSIWQGFFQIDSIHWFGCKQCFFVVVIRPHTCHSLTHPTQVITEQLSVIIYWNAFVVQGVNAKYEHFTGNGRTHHCQQIHELTSFISCWPTSTRNRITNSGAPR